MSQRSKNAKRVAAIAATAGVALIVYNFLRLDRPVDRPHITAAMVKRAVPDYAVIDKESDQPFTPLAPARNRPRRYGAGRGRNCGG